MLERTFSVSGNVLDALAGHNFKGNVELRIPSNLSVPRLKIKKRKRSHSSSGDAGRDHFGDRPERRNEGCQEPGSADHAGVQASDGCRCGHGRIYTLQGTV